MSNPAYIKFVVRWVVIVSGVFLALTPVLIFSMALSGFAGPDEMAFMVRWGVASAGFLIVGAIAGWAIRRKSR